MSISLSTSASFAQAPYLKVNYNLVAPSNETPSKQLSIDDLKALPESSKTDGFFAAQAVIDSTNSVSKDGAKSQQQVEQSSPSNSDMPSALTSPVLPNVPSALDDDGLVVLPHSDNQGAGEASKTDQSSETGQRDATKPVQKGPAMRRNFSVLFTQQRPFLLYSQDASITYLMPNALVDHPGLGRYLRSFLESRALKRWQELRENRTAEELENGGRPSLVINGRIEDRFYSSTLSSLFLEEQESWKEQTAPKEVLSFNFRHQDNKPFGLTDIFKKDSDGTLSKSIELITAYVQADIVRQKTIRLGTQVTPEQDAWLNALKPQLELLQTFNLVPSKQIGKAAGLAFHFNPGLLGAEADGPYTVYVPSSIFTSLLNEEFADLFGGEALMVSRHSAKGFSSASINIDGLKANAELGGDMVLDGEVPGNWCDGFQLTLIDRNSGQIVTEGNAQMMPELPTFGIAGNMLRFRADITVTGSGGNEGSLVFEPLPVTVDGDRIAPRKDTSCSADDTITLPDPARDSISIPVIY